MSAAPMVDAQRLSLMLGELRLPTVKHLWGDCAAQADKEGWPASRFLAGLAEHELAERDRRRIERHLAEAHLPAGKTLDCFAFDAVPMISKAQVMALCVRDGWLERGANLILFGSPSGGKSHLAAAIGLALVDGAGGFCSPELPTSSSACRSPDRPSAPVPGPPQPTPPPRSSRPYATIRMRTTTLPATIKTGTNRRAGTITFSS